MDGPLVTWQQARNAYDYCAALSDFKTKAKYPGFFGAKITPATTEEFETKFRCAINGNGSYVTAGEVCFWKNYGMLFMADKLTYKLLQHLAPPVSWSEFCSTVKDICTSPAWANFKRLQIACDMPFGFAVPLTFISFYHHRDYPMADQHIAAWWAMNKVRFGYATAPTFSQAPNGAIQATQKSWQAYLAWTEFCCDYAPRLGNWRARDVEMAVWMAQRRGWKLSALL